MKRPRPHGYALMAVIGLMALLVILIATAQTAVQFSHKQQRRLSDRLELQEALTAIVTDYGRLDAPARATVPLELEFGRTAQAVIARRTLEAGDPLYGELVGLRPRPGDALLTVELSGESVAAEQRRFIVNALGQRPGAISLGGGLAPATLAESPTSTSTLTTTATEAAATTTTQ